MKIRAGFGIPPSKKTIFRAAKVMHLSPGHNARRGTFKKTSLGRMHKTRCPKSNQYGDTLRHEEKGMTSSESASTATRNGHPPPHLDITSQLQSVPFPPLIHLQLPIDVQFTPQVRQIHVPQELHRARHPTVHLHR